MTKVRTLRKILKDCGYTVNDILSELNLTEYQYRRKINYQDDFTLEEWNILSMMTGETIYSLKLRPY